MRDAQDDLVFRNRLFVRSRIQRKVEIVAFATLLLVPVAMIVMFRQLAPPDTDWFKLAKTMADRVDPVEVAALSLALTLTLLFQVYAWLAARRERLILGDSGIRYVSPLPAALKFLRPDWTLAWAEVRTARFARSPLLAGPMAPGFVLDAGGVSRSIRPYLWVDEKELAQLEAQTPGQALRVARETKGEALAAHIESSALMRGIRAKLAHLRINDAACALPSPEFALEKNLRSLIATGLFFALIAYAIADFMINHETYVETPSYEVFAAAGIGLAVLSIAWLRRGNVPTAESCAIALLLGIGSAAALYPGLLRLNQMTDPVGLQSFRYVLESDALLRPEQEDMPMLAFPDLKAYWSQFPQGSVHEFSLRKGALDFWQVDMAPVHAQTRKFYSKQS